MTECQHNSVTADKKPTRLNLDTVKFMCVECGELFYMVDADPTDAVQYNTNGEDELSYRRTR